LNVVVVAVGIVIASPLLLMIAIAIKVSSSGAVVCTQSRLEFDRRRWSIDNSKRHRGSDDRGGRLFTIYKFRTTWPEQPEIFAELQEVLGRKYRQRQKVLPGITGLAQVTLGYDTDIAGVKRKVAKDLEYTGQRSAAGDLVIIAKTVPVMVFRKVWM
jgi:lipopolysaccharide/colanic/teichoic acid biosynthesis glycosyltransferase